MRARLYDLCVAETVGMASPSQTSATPGTSTRAGSTRLQSAHVVQKLEQCRVVCCNGCANAGAAHRLQRSLLPHQSLLFNLHKRCSCHVNSGAAALSLTLDGYVISQL